MRANTPPATLATFEARIHRSKNRQVSIPAEVQRQLGLARRKHNHIIRVSIRPSGAGYWNQHYLKLTSDNEFSIPSDVTGLAPGDTIQVRVHSVLADTPMATVKVAETGAAVLLRLANEPGEGWRTDGSRNLDAYLTESMRD